MRKVDNRSGISKRALLTPTSAADIVYAIVGGDRTGSMTGAFSNLVRNNPAEFNRIYNTLSSAERTALGSHMSETGLLREIGFRPATTTMPISYRPGTTALRGAGTALTGTAETATVAAPVATEAATVAAAPVATEVAAAGAGTAATGAGVTAAGAISIGAAAAALLAYPKIGQLIYGGIDEDQLKTGDPSDILRTGLIRTVQNYWQPIIECDVADWDYGGDLSDIADFENARIIKNYADILHASTTSIRMRDYALKQITLDNISRELANAQDQSGGSWAARFIVGGRDDRSYDMIRKSPCVAKGVADFTGWVAQYISTLKSHDPILAAKSGGGEDKPNVPQGGGNGGGNGGGGGGVPRTTRNESLDYVGASEIMIEKGFLDTVQTSWTPKFDSAFRGFVDAATKAAENINDTKLVSGQTWGEASDEIGFTPDARGGIIAVKRLAKFIGTEKVPSTTGEDKPATPEAPKGEAPAVSGKVNVLAEMIGILYNERLVEGGGFLSYEKKQTQSLVDAIGGAGPSGFPNAAKVLLKRNPQLESVVPDKLATPITKKTIKGTELATAFKMVQQTIHDIYESANPGMINPGKNKATENVKKYLGTMAGGSWKEASFSQNRFVKLAEERRERIRREIEANLTPAERAAMRRLRVRGA